MIRTRLGLLFIVAASGMAFCVAEAGAQASDDRFPAAWASVPLPGQDAIEVAASEPVPFPRPAPRRGRKAAEQVASAVTETADEEVAAAPEPNRALLAYAGDDRFSLLWQGEQSMPAMNGGVAETGEPAQAVPFPRSAPTRIGRLSSAVGGETASRMGSGSSFPVPKSVPGDLAATIAAKAQEHGVPLALAHAVIRVESNYNPRLTGHGGPLGLMQIKHSTARGLGFTGSAKELFDPATNLEWGMRYLAGAQKLAKGDLCHTVLKYQGGHYAMHMTRASSIYCGKVKTYMAVVQ